MTDINEDLRKWFKEKWVRFDTKGNIKGECAKEPGEGKPKCLPMAKAHALGKEKRASAARRKRKQDPHAGRKGKAKFVKTHNEEVLLEKNVPTNPKLWAQAKAQAKKKFKIYPSAYANGWAAKWYKSKGGGWKSLNEDYEHEMARNELRTAMRGIERLMKHLDGEGDLEAWVQSKLTKAADYIDTLADYMDSRDETVKEAYEIIEEAKKKMDKKTIPQTIQNMTPGSNPYADDSTSPSYVVTPGNPITEESLKATYKKLMKSRKPGVKKRREELRNLAKQRAAAKQATEKRQKELYPGPKELKTPSSTPAAPAKQMVPPMKSKPETPSPMENTSTEPDTFREYLHHIGRTGERLDPRIARYHINRDYMRLRATALAKDHPVLRAHAIEAAEEYKKDSISAYRDIVGSPVHKLLKAIRLREEHGAGDMGTTELTNKYIEHTPGQLPLDDRKKRLSDIIKQTIKEEVLCEAVPRIGVGQTTRRTIRSQENKRHAPPGTKVTIKRPTVKHNVATRGPGPIRKLRPGATVAGGIRNTAKFVKAATKRRRSVQSQMGSNARARFDLTRAARG